MPMTRTTFTLEDSLAQRARDLDINVSAAAREGVEVAVRQALAEIERKAYLAKPEVVDEFWLEAEAWGDE